MENIPKNFSLYILAHGIAIADDVFQYLWFRLQTPKGEIYRCITYSEVCSLPSSILNRSEFLKNNNLLMRILYNEGIVIIRATLGIFTPESVGVVQLYGTIGEGDTLPEAAEKSLKNIVKINTGLDFYHNIQTRPPDIRYIEWFSDFANKTQNPEMFLGHTKPPDGFLVASRILEDPNSIYSNLHGDIFMKSEWLQPYQLLPFHLDQDIDTLSDFDKQLIIMKQIDARIQQLSSLRRDFAYVVILTPVPRYILTQILIKSVLRRKKSV